MKQCMRCGSYNQDDAMNCTNCDAPFYAQQPAPMYPSAPSGIQPMSVGEWVGTIILSCLGPIGLILMFVWAFGSDTHPDKKAWARANLLITAVVLVLTIVLVLVFGAGLAGVLSRSAYY